MKQFINKSKFDLYQLKGCEELEINNEKDIEYLHDIFVLNPKNGQYIYVTDTDVFKKYFTIYGELFDIGNGDTIEPSLNIKFGSKVCVFNPHKK